MLIFSGSDRATSLKWNHYLASKFRNMHDHSENEGSGCVTSLKSIGFSLHFDLEPARLEPYSVATATSVEFITGFCRWSTHHRAGVARPCNLALAKPPPRSWIAMPE